MVSPEFHIAGHKLAALVDANRFCIARLPTDPNQCRYNVFAAIAELGIQHRHIPRECVDHVQNAQLFTCRQLIVNEVISPDILGPPASVRLSRSLAFNRGLAADVDCDEFYELEEAFHTMICRLIVERRDYFAADPGPVAGWLCERLLISRPHRQV